MNVKGGATILWRVMALSNIVLQIRNREAHFPFLGEGR